MADWNHLSPSEYDKISSVLKRDRDLRSTEQMRIKQLKQELLYLRKRAALRPGFDPLRNCARCLSELGRILNRGASCPKCLKKVCRDCRHYEDENHEWLCIYCFKQMQLKAISGQWMQEFSKVRKSAKHSPTNQLRVVLHESQRNDRLGSRNVEQKHVQDATEIPPKKPPRSYEYEFSCDEVICESPSRIFEKKDIYFGQGNGTKKDTSSLSPKILEKVSPWNDIDPEPTIPVRVDKTRSFGSVQQYDHLGQTPAPQLSTDGHHPKLNSTSNEVMDENDNLSPVPLPRNRITVLKKQNQITEPNTLEKQESSEETVDSGVSSPGLKLEAYTNITAPAPTLASNGILCGEHEGSSHPFDQCPICHLPNDSSSTSSSSTSSDDTETDYHSVSTKSQDTLFRKVSLKKRKARSSSISQEKRSATIVSEDESGNSLRSTQHGRLRMRNRSLSGGSEDGRQRKTSVPQISVSEWSEKQLGPLSASSSEKDSSGIHEDEIDQAFAYHCRSQMSLSSFGARSESVTSVYSAAGGGRYGTVVVTGEVLFGLIYNHNVGFLEVHIKECRNLAAVDIKKKRSDPYVKVYLLPDRTKSGKRKTKVKKHTLNPIFDECLKFPVGVYEVGIRTLWLSVWHSDRFGRNDFLGEVMLPLDNNMENSTSKWYPLQERMEILDAPVSYKGDLILALKYVPPDVTSRKLSKKAGMPVKGALEVLIREAHNLMATRSNGTSDPFCKSYLLPDKSKSGKQKTPVLKKTCNPKWNHTFIYDDVSLDDLRERCLELTIWDYDKITSNDFLGGVRLCLGTAKYQGRDADWMDSVGEERSLWYTMLERPNTWVDGSLLLRPNMQSRRTV